MAVKIKTKKYPIVSSQFIFFVCVGVGEGRCCKYKLSNGTSHGTSRGTSVGNQICVAFFERLAQNKHDRTLARPAALVRPLLK